MPATDQRTPTPLSPFTISSCSSASEFQANAISAYGFSTHSPPTSAHLTENDGGKSDIVGSEIPKKTLVENVQKTEEDEEEDIQTFIMGTNISDIPFLDLWKLMNKKLGWKYLHSKVKYQAPPLSSSHAQGKPLPLIFDSAIDLVAFLDGNDSTIDKYSCNWSCNQNELLKRALLWKKDTLTAYYTIVKRNTRQYYEKEIQKQSKIQEKYRKLTYGFGGNGAICDVCFQLEGTPSSSTSFSPFVTCKTCALLVHYDCYLPLPQQMKDKEKKKKASPDSSKDEVIRLGKGCAVPNVGLDEDGFFLCDVCRRNQTDSKVTAPKYKNDAYFFMKETVEAKCDGRVHPDVTCELCLRKDVCGGLKLLAASVNNWVHLACVQCIPEAFCQDNKVCFGTITKEKKGKTVHELIQGVTNGGDSNTGFTSLTCDACSRSGGLLLPCSSNECEYRLHPLCAELSSRKRIVDKNTNCISYHCAVHSFTNKCSLCYQVHFQKDMIQCSICTHRFHKKCLQKEILEGRRNHRTKKSTVTPNDCNLVDYESADDEHYCNSCIQEGLANGALIEVKQPLSMKKQQMVKYTRRNLDNTNNIATSSSSPNILTILKQKSKPTEEKKKNTRSATAIEDGAEVYFSRNKKVKASVRQLSSSIISKSDMAHYETEKKKIVHNDGGNEINEYTAAASKPQRSTTKKKQSAKSTNEELLNKWPSPQECVDYLLSHDVRTKHSYQLAELERKHREHFSEWSFLLKTNHSLLLYGYGSKRQLLNNFSNKLSDEGHYVANIQGYHTDVTMNGILDSIVIGFLNGIEPSLGVGQQFLSGSHKLLKRAECIARALAASKNCLYIVLHNIDGIGLRNSVAQSSLAALVVHGTVNNVRRIRLVASMDHVNSAVFLWDARTRASFSWIWKEVTTFLPYFEEVKYGIPESAMSGSKLLGNQRQNDKGIKDVLRSLAPRYSETLKLLAALQLAADAACQESKMTSDGVEYNSFRVHCQNKMLVTSDNALRLMLNELKDHDIVSFTVGKDGNERIYIPYAQNVLQMIIDF